MNKPGKPAGLRVRSGIRAGEIKVPDEISGWWTAKSFATGAIKGSAGG